MNKIFSFGMKQISGILDMTKTKGPSDKEIYTSVLHEITYYMGRLTKNLLISSEILIDVARM
jgi:hypothetical protein